MLIYGSTLCAGERIENRGSAVFLHYRARTGRKPLKTGDKVELKENTFLTLNQKEPRDRANIYGCLLNPKATSGCFSFI